MGCRVVLAIFDEVMLIYIWVMSFFFYAWMLTGGF